jgi:hypothetical protein
VILYDVLSTLIAVASISRKQFSKDGIAETFGPEALEKKNAGFGEHCHRPSRRSWPRRVVRTARSNGGGRYESKTVIPLRANEVIFAQ